MADFSPLSHLLLSSMCLCLAEIEANAVGGWVRQELISRLNDLLLLSVHKKPALGYLLSDQLLMLARMQPSHLLNRTKFVPSCYSSSSFERKCLHQSQNEYIFFRIQYNTMYLFYQWIICQDLNYL